MPNYKYEELGKHYALNKSLKSYRPQWQPILGLVPENSKVLDVGCGDGVLGEMLRKQKGSIVFGSYLHKVAVLEAKRKGITAQVHDANLRLPFKSKGFDYVICNEVLEFLTEPEKAISEALRVGKTVILEFPNFGFWYYRLEMLLGRFPKKALFGYSPFNTHQIKFFSYRDFLEFKVIRGVEIKRVICINWRNKKVSFLAKFNPNLFGRSCIVVLTSKHL